MNNIESNFINLTIMVSLDYVMVLTFVEFQSILL